MTINEATWQYVRQHGGDDVRQLALQGVQGPDIDLPVALRQIQGRQTARQKMPSWAAIDGIVYPVHLSMEQCSSEATERYKAAVCRRLLAGRPTADATHVDLTGGLGVDFAFMSEAFGQSTYVERDPELAAISSDNFRLLGKQVTTVCADGVDYLHRQVEHATLIFLDPARRDDCGGRTYGIADCSPNVLSIRDELLAKADFLMLKLSPMLDWRKAVQDLGPVFVKEVHIVSVRNECNELLIVMQPTDADGFTLFCSNDEQQFTVSAGEDPAQPSLYVQRLQPQMYLYEPNASLMKAGCFAAVASAYQVQRLAPNSHLFAADRLVAGFPGRCFRISAISSMNKKTLGAALKGLTKANITVRNFPLSVAALRKRLRLGEGGSDYIFATTLADGAHVLLVCRKADI